MTPPPVSANAARQRGGRKDGGGRFRAYEGRDHRVREQESGSGWRPAVAVYLNARGM